MADLKEVCLGIRMTSEKARFLNNFYLSYTKNRKAVIEAVESWFDGSFELIDIGIIIRAAFTDDDPLSEPMEQMETEDSPFRCPWKTQDELEADLEIAKQLQPRAQEYPLTLRMTVRLPWGEISELGQDVVFDQILQWDGNRPRHLDEDMVFIFRGRRVYKLRKLLMKKCFCPWSPAYLGVFLAQRQDE